MTKESQNDWEYWQFFLQELFFYWYIFTSQNFEIKTTTLVILNSCVGFFTVSKKSSLGCSIGIWMKCFKSFYSGRLGNKRYSRSITSYQRVPILYELYEPILYDSYNMSHILWPIYAFFRMHKHIWFSCLISYIQWTILIKSRRNCWMGFG